MGSRKVCSGTYGDGFWANSTAELSRRINEVNLDSLGSRRLFGRDIYGVTHDELYLENYLASANNFSIVQNGW